MKKFVHCVFLQRFPGQKGGSAVTQGVFILLLLSATPAALADATGSALKQAYQATQNEPDPVKRAKAYREALAAPIREKEEADKRKDQEQGKRLGNDVRRAGTDPAKLEALKQQYLDRAKKEGKAGVKAPTGSVPAPVATATPIPGTYAPVVRPARVEQPSGPSAPAGYQGPVEGGGLSEVIDFNPQPMKTPTPTPSKKR